MKNLLLVGNIGSGKSSFGNRLLGSYVFKNAYFQKGESIKYKIIESVGFGGLNFFKEYLKFKNTIIECGAINAFVLVVKFEEKEATSFLSSVKDFYLAFGDAGLKSLMLVCIQGSNRLIMSNSDFKQCLFASDGYKFLIEKKGEHIPYCLWDNLNPHRYPSQQEDFDNCLFHLHPYDIKSIHFSFQLIEKEIEIMELKQQYQIRLFKNAQK